MTLVPPMPNSLQQYLPFTVLKRFKQALNSSLRFNAVAIVLTVYGIETFTVSSSIVSNSFTVATVLTVYGIEAVIRLLHMG